MMRLYFQALLIVGIAYKLLSAIDFFLLSVSQLETLWRQDYRYEFCRYYFAWRENMSAARKWLVAEPLDAETRRVAQLRLRDLLDRQLANYPADRLAWCEAHRDDYVIYFQEHPELFQPYPNWSVHYDPANVMAEEAKVEIRGI
jgi:hypothetical protein